ncbi:esterase/lipase family protein [Propioniciclava soli]|uniref:esterase/lipase family protein n=1 Tax=Propioniciclava soli TaxID=2775081 RepID=UPI001E517E48|nr:alpha/beta hydrolase [Propioniciclava soli]
MNVREKVGIVVRDWLHVAGRQVAALLDRTPARRLLAVPRPCPEGRIPVLLLPGVYEPWRYLKPLGEFLRDAGHPVHVVDQLGWNVSSLEAAADVVEAFVADRGLERCVVVAHSKGGLIGLLTMTRPGLDARIAGVVAVASPFRGSSRGLRLAALSHLREFAPTASGITTIAALDVAQRRVSSLVPAWDEMIPEGSTLEGARNVPLAASGHFLPLMDERVWWKVHAEVHRWA